MTKTLLQVEVNSAAVAASDTFVQPGGGVLMITPPIDEDFWLLRVPLGENAIVTFPKFGTYGIGFQREQDWNTNLPYTVPADEIWEHIKHNRADKTITKARGVAAIRLLQAKLREVLGAEAKPERGPRVPHRVD